MDVSTKLLLKCGIVKRMGIWGPEGVKGTRVTRCMYGRKRDWVKNRNRRREGEERREVGEKAH